MYSNVLISTPVFSAATYHKSFTLQRRDNQKGHQDRHSHHHIHHKSQEEHSQNQEQQTYNMLQSHWNPEQSRDQQLLREKRHLQAHSQDQMKQ